MREAGLGGQLDVQARVVGPPVGACFDCDGVVPLPYLRWYGELSSMGQLVALLPYCDRCSRRRECKQAEQQLQIEDG